MLSADSSQNRAETAGRCAPSGGNSFHSFIMVLGEEREPCVRRGLGVVGSGVVEFGFGSGLVGRRNGVMSLGHFITLPRGIFFSQVFLYLPFVHDV